MGHARKERVLLFGTRSADYIRASSQRLHSKAEYMAAPERFAEMSDFSLAPRAPSIHGPSLTSISRSPMSAFRGKADLQKTAADVAL
jgi:hypothetical protein